MHADQIESLTENEQRNAFHMPHSSRRRHLYHLRLSAFICGYSLIFGIMSGCHLGGVITPPAYVEQPTTIYLKLDARHSAIAFPRDSVRYVEYSFGAWRWFAYADTRWPVAIGSLGGFMQSTLQSNEYPVSGGVPLTKFEVAFIPITVDRRRADALRMELDARFARRADTFHYNEAYDMYFVEDREHYWIFNNCNQVTAQWLRRLGCHVGGWTLTNDFRVHRTGGRALSSRTVRRRDLPVVMRGFAGSRGERTYHYR